MTDENGDIVYFNRKRNLLRRFLPHHQESAKLDPNKAMGSALGSILDGGDDEEGDGAASTGAPEVTDAPETPNPPVEAETDPALLWEPARDQGTSCSRSHA